MAREGKFVLRTQLRPDRTYHVAYQTPNGGWGIYNQNWKLISKEACDNIIAELVNKDPEKFFIDDDLI